MQHARATGEWRLLQRHEGGATFFQDGDERFGLKADFGTMLDLDPGLSIEEVTSEDWFATRDDRRRVAVASGYCQVDRPAGVSVYAADVGSTSQGRFAWWRVKIHEPGVGGHDLAELVTRMAADLDVGGRISLGFECPLSVPGSNEPLELGRGRPGEGNRPWCAAAGATTLALGIAQLRWVLENLRRLAGVAIAPTFTWPEFARSPEPRPNLHLWEALVTGSGRGTHPGVHLDDARSAAEEFVWRAGTLDGGDFMSDVTAASPTNLAALALLRTGITVDVGLLAQPLVVIHARR